MKQIWIVAALILALLPCTAFSKPSCPEGHDGYVNINTYELVCVPTGELPNAQVSEPNTPVETAQDTAAQNDTLIQDPEPSIDIATASEDVVDEQPAVEDVVSENTEIVHDPEEKQLSPVMRMMYNDLIAQKEAEDGVRRKGFNLSLGVGYGYYVSLDVNLNFGYEFSDHEKFGFGLFLDTNFKVGVPRCSFDIVLEPAFIVKSGNFRFTLGLGVGTMIYQYYNGEYDEYEDIISTGATFIIKPALKFDWFLTENTWLGFETDIPWFVVEGFAWFGVYFRAGYKF